MNSGNSVDTRSARPAEREGVGKLSPKTTCRTCSRRTLTFGRSQQAGIGGRLMRSCQHLRCSSRRLSRRCSVGRHSRSSQQRRPTVTTQSASSLRSASLSADAVGLRAHRGSTMNMPHSHLPGFSNSKDESPKVIRGPQTLHECNSSSWTGHLVKPTNEYRTEWNPSEKQVSQARNF